MSRKILVRNYRSDDLTHVKEILSEYPSPTGRVWSEDMVKEMLSDALREQPDGVFVAEMGGKVVGLAVVIHRDWFNISLPLCSQGMLEWINRGVGHKLIERCISWAREKGLRIIYTETGKNNEGAIRFYQRHGFDITGYIPDYYKKELDAVILVRKLS